MFSLSMKVLRSAFVLPLRLETNRSPTDLSGANCGSRASKGPGDDSSVFGQSVVFFPLKIAAEQRPQCHRADRVAAKLGPQGSEVSCRISNSLDSTLNYARGDKFKQFAASKAKK